MTSPHPSNPTSNISLGNNPFIWGNIALLAVVPWLLALSMAGLAVGDPVFPEWFEIFLLGFPAIALVAWVQWQQPISPFSLWFVAKPSESLNDQERQILTLVKQHSNGWYVTGWIATAVAIVMSAIFCKIYISAPLAQAIAPFPSGLRLFGILWTEIFFLLSNVILQAGISALRIKLTADTELNGLKLFNPEKIKSSFTSVGWKSPQILKFFEEDAISGVSDYSPKVEVAKPPLDVNESQEVPDTESIEPNNLITEVEPDAVSEINAVEDTVCETEAIADITEDLVVKPLEFVKDSEVEESLDFSEIIAEPEIETIAQEECIQEPEELEPIGFFAAPEIESLNVIDTSFETEIEPATNTEIADVSLDHDFVEEAEDLEFSEIIAEESLIEAISEPEVEQLIEDTQFESNINLEIVQETEGLNQFELIEDEKSDIKVLDSTRDQSNLDEEIDEEAKELEAFKIDEEPELTFLEIPNASPKTRIKENEQADGNLEVSDDILDKQITEDCEELESLESMESSEDEEVADTALTSDSNLSLNFLKKSRKSVGTPKKQGFGKPIKRDIISSPDAIEPSESINAIEPDAIANPIIEIESDLDFPVPISELEMIQELDESPNLEAIATPIEQDLEATEIKSQDFDNELDEFIAFNTYVENILKEYLKDNDEESKNEEPLDEEPPEQIDPSIVFDPAIEATMIAKESVEAFTENLPDLETQVPIDTIEEVSSNEKSPKNPEFLVQEFLVDKFFARIEELNIADKASKSAVEKTTENISKPDSEIDEFADLEALLDGKPENPDAI
ncbi:MAG: low-complexity tail membrane protein [Pseudanabaena sp. M135S2SP2A07QC]|nr:low-complexity tail membrane protein [Pseudanabaena sp. M090S1SP2A07QC]MCA6507032.1 low-complexity tail membrane protein [Pseudanabaena sp. M172S2SP2A07QC]MCA6523724.1 low-complexity tail membrane protein [Pseudanabaena sp. M051S1SP2A07QC]MCA6525266.1 low-complexity tail membrane protein [Pseudanabaena sp. M179S2SP2A07QC]MCA6531023.1 low-complexity tail membrane protein [Pseudanabaena sp. M125S2SP2A07QC]MCA6534352.1 low-complexity tail membrane protein [Pseudanabaena sp. M176S2SP2A07QC]MCA